MDVPEPLVRCPFQVGDRILDKPYGVEATVTAVRQDEIEYRYDEPALIHPLYGSAIGGTCRREGWHLYEKI